LPHLIWESAGTAVIHRTIAWFVVVVALTELIHVCAPASEVKIANKRKSREI